MDELEYRLRDLDVVADPAGRLPAAGELRRRGDRKRRIQRAQLAVGTFALVAAIAGGTTIWLNGVTNQAEGTPAGPTSPSVSSPSTPADPDPTPSSSSGVSPTQPSDKVVTDANEGYWIWAPPAADGKRMLTLSSDGGFDLSRKNKKVAKGDWLGYTGSQTLMPVQGSPGEYLILNPENSEEADAHCFTVVEAGVVLEVCDNADVKQHFAISAAKGGYTFESVSRSAYLKAEGRELSWTTKAQEATVFSLERVP